jgi:hypothetical protein
MESVADLGWNRFLWLEWNGEFLGAEVDRYYRGIHFSGPRCFELEDATPLAFCTSLNRTLRLRLRIRGRFSS